MGIEATQLILARAFRDGYGVPAINVVNDLTMEAVLSAADSAASPVIVQTSVKTVRQIGARVLFAMWREMAARVSVPVSIHLDHCPDREVISECLRLGWNSVLFDGSGLTAAENLRQAVEVVAEATPYGAMVEGELEGIRGVEDGIGSDLEADRQPLGTVVDFIHQTGIGCFAPAIGNAHGTYSSTPTLDAERVSEIVAATGIPIALHGGSGLAPEQFTDLIARGCAKVNISTALKLAYIRAHSEYLAANPRASDPPAMFAHVRAAVVAMTLDHIKIFGSAGRGR